MDDPNNASTPTGIQNSVLYDPQPERLEREQLLLASAQAPAAGGQPASAQPASAQPASSQPASTPASTQPASTQPATSSVVQPPAAPGDSTRAPRSPPSWAYQNGSLILIGSDEDIEEAFKALEQVIESAKLTNAELRIFPLERADATSVAALVNQVYQRLNLTAGGASPTQQPLQSPSVLILAIPRVNGILVVAPANQMKDIDAHS